MTGRPSNRSSQTQAMPPAAARQNDYFVPRDGIDREVITSDICRYLGNDALVRPGTYESPDGRVTQGYFITAYRNLTSAMIQDLKADSARWEQERRAASRSTGAGGSREPRGQSDYSAWKNSLREQEYQASYGSAMDIDYAPPPGATGNPSYPTQAYQGVAQANYGTATYPPPIQGSTAQYPGQPAYTYTMNPPAVQYSPPPQNPSDRYSAIPPPAVPGTYGQDAAAAFVHGSNYQALPGFTAAGPARIPPPTMPHAAGAPSRTFSAPPAAAPVYGTDTDPYSYAQQPGNPAAAAAQAYPADPHYGRGAYAATTSKLPEAPSDDLGSPAGTTQQPRQGYPAPVDPQYDDLQANPGLQSATTPTAAAPAQMPPPPTGAPPARRDRDSEPREREREREHRDHRARRSEQERDDRHADRNRHRHRQ